MTKYTHLQTPQGVTALPVPLPFYIVKNIAVRLCAQGTRTKCECWNSEERKFFNVQPKSNP